MNKKELDKKVQSNIDQYGLNVRHVLEDDKGPGFTYSIGLFKTYDHPEIIIIGLKQQLAHILINNMADNIKGGKIYAPFKFEADILDDFECYLIDVDKSNYDSYVGGAQRYYGDEQFPLLQCVYPTVKGFYPWQNEWPENIRNLQPLLGPININ